MKDIKSLNVSNEGALEKMDNIPLADKSCNISSRMALPHEEIRNIGNPHSNASHTSFGCDLSCECLTECLGNTVQVLGSWSHAFCNLQIEWIALTAWALLAKTTRWQPACAAAVKTLYVPTMFVGRSERMKSAAGEGSAARCNTISMPSHALTQAEKSVMSIERTGLAEFPKSSLRSVSAKSKRSATIELKAFPIRPAAPVTSSFGLPIRPS